MKNKDFNNAGKTSRSNSSNKESIDVSRENKKYNQRDESIDSEQGSEIDSSRSASTGRDMETPVSRPTRQWDQKKGQSVDEETSVPSRRTQSTDSSGAIDGFSDSEDLKTSSSNMDEDEELTHLADEDLDAADDQNDVDGDKRSY